MASSHERLVSAKFYGISQKETRKKIISTFAFCTHVDIKKYLKNWRFPLNSRRLSFRSRHEYDRKTIEPLNSMHVN